MENEFSWVYNPWQESRIRGLILSAVILTVGIYLGDSLGINSVSLLLWIAFLLSLRTLLFPSFYRVRESGIARLRLPGIWQLYVWEKVRRVQTDRGWVLVSPHRRQTRWDRFQAWEVPLPPEQSAEVLDLLHRKCKDNHV